VARSRLSGAVVLAALVFPGTAAAHIRTGTIAVDYRVTVDRAPRGVSVHVYPGDRSLRLSAARGHTVLVRGYLGGPFLRIGASGRVSVVRTSPTAAAAKARVSGRSVVWHDARVRGTRPGRWAISLVVDGRRAVLGGTIERVSRPAVWPWLALGAPFLVGAALLLRRRRLRSLELAGLVLGVFVVAAIAVAAAGFALDPNATEGRWVEAANEVVFAAVGIAVLVRGSPQTRVLAAGALGLLGLAVGVSKLPVFAHGDVLTALPDDVVRAAVALMLWASAVAVAIGAAVFVEALDDDALQLRRAADV
jgi:hypothetical protein